MTQSTDDRLRIEATQRDPARVIAVHFQRFGREHPAAEPEPSSENEVAGVTPGFRTITPFIIHEKAPELVDFMKSVFDAEELKRNTAGEAYGFYSEVRIGDTVIAVGGGTAAYTRAIEAGATSVRPPGSTAAQIAPSAPEHSETP